MAASEASEANDEMRGILDPLIHSHRVVPQARRSTGANRTRGQNIVLSEQRTHAYRRLGELATWQSRLRAQRMVGRPEYFSPSHKRHEDHLDPHI